MPEQNHDKIGLRRIFRTACYGSAIMTVIAYAVLFPLKWHGLLPADMTWSRIVVGPIIIGSLVPIAVGGRSDSYGFIRLGVWMLLVALLSFAAHCFDLITGCP